MAPKQKPAPKRKNKQPSLWSVCHPCLPLSTVSLRRPVTPAVLELLVAQLHCLPYATLAFVGPADEGLSLDELHAKTQHQVEAMERQLCMPPPSSACPSLLRTEEAKEARAQEQELKERYDAMCSDLESAQQRRFDVISDFTRQHKGMQDELISRITDLESTVCVLMDRLELSRIAHRETEKDRNQAIAQKDKETQEQRARITEMEEEFKKMLEETLEQMGHKIHLNLKDAEAEKASRSTAASQGAEPNSTTTGVGGTVDAGGDVDRGIQQAQATESPQGG
eukprot:gene10418-1888_t